MFTALAIVTALIVVFAIVLGGAYTSGSLDPIIEKIGIRLFKAKAKAEKKQLQAEGLQEGKDFFNAELKGNQQAQEVAMGFGDMDALSSIKKSL